MELVDQFPAAYFLCSIPDFLMQIIQCLHTAIVVSDLEKAEHFYGTVLGLPKVERSLKFAGAWYEVAGYQIHLIADSPTQAAAYAALPKPDKWGRDRHLAFTVRDLDAAKQQLVAHGYSVQTSASGRAALFTQDPDGNIIELSQGE